MCAYIGCNRCDFNVGSVIDGRYTVDKQLGEGGFGKVYRVVRNSDSKVFALKLLKLWAVEAMEREKLCKRFDQEYETGRIASDYLVQACGKGMAEGNPYIVMEYCPGGDLGQGVESGRVDLAKAASEVLLGLQVLHSNGKVHRDLKPENVLLKRDGSAALTDFGISGDRNKRLTERGVLGVPKEIFGTYAYMPPEQVNPRRGDATVLPTTDLFSFGVMMYQLLTLELPFGRLETQSDLYEYVRRGKNGDWNRAELGKTQEGRKWIPLVEGCLRPDFRHRIQTSAAAIALVPGSRQPVRAGEEAIPIVPQVRTGVALRIMQGEEYGKTYRLTALQKSIGKRILTIGRNDGETRNDLSIKETQSAYVSRRHCTLEYDSTNGTWLLRDGQWDPSSGSGWKTSTNGTYVGSTEVPTNGVSLQIGDIISIGDVKFRFEGY